MHILITAGGTEEPIDGVRSISNFSTGKTGALLADYFSSKGAQVTLLKGLRSLSPEREMDVELFSSFQDLNCRMENRLKNHHYDAVIHLAAVSDFSLDFIESGGEKVELTSGKMDSSKPLTIHLKPNFKILDRIKSYASYRLILVGFKLTKNASLEVIKEKVMGILNKNQVDFLVHNDLSEISETHHKTTIYSDETTTVQTENKSELCRVLYKLIREKL